MAAMSRVWESPHPGAEHPQGLRLYNSLLDEKVPFVPRGGPGCKRITWYNCGPTVYDSAHMGHARNYLTVDILRRVLEGYFGYNIFFVMNVTDVDDKIIKRARLHHLLGQYRASNLDPPSVLRFAREAAAAAVERARGKVGKAEAALAEAKSAAEAGDKAQARVVQDTVEALEQERLKLSQAEGTARALEERAAAGQSTVEEVLGVAGDVVAEALDREKGADLRDPGVFRAHAARYEKEFLEDMEALGVRPPDAMPRVSEYVPEIVAYVEKIVAQGMAYASGGSVYFDTAAFRARGHVYGKLNPWAVGSMLAAEGEVGGEFACTEKRNPQDFALWKASKPGEPAWDSPWGPGRPGWHIECSAMASSLVGSSLDIHSGGHDLRFPHHTNELAQAEAFFDDCGCHQWVDYFLHTGHLNIEGLKMSKSLKNFITIRQALATFSPRQLRLMFLLQPWDKSMMYGEGAQQEMRTREAALRNFFANVQVVLRETRAEGSTKWESEEGQLAQAVAHCEADVHASLCDNVNTRGAMDALAELIKACNLYMSAREQSAAQGGGRAQPLLLRKAAALVTRVCALFGLGDGATDRLGLGGSGEGADDAGMTGVMDALANFRDDVRGIARGGAPMSAVLEACDRVRDHTLVDLGIRLEDRPTGKAVWKKEDPAVLRAEVEAKERAAMEAKTKKLLSALERKERDLEKLQKLAELPRVQDALRDRYSRFDDAGDPTHDAEGKALDDKAAKKAKKDVEKERKIRAPLEKAMEKDGPDVVQRLAAEVQEIKAELSALGLA